MSRKEVDFELRAAIKSEDQFIRRIIILMQVLLKIKTRIEKNNLYDLFVEIYLTDKHPLLDEIAVHQSIDSKTLRRKRILFNKIYIETKNEMFNLQNDFFNGAK